MMTDGRRVRPDAISNIFVDTSRSKAAFARLEILMERGWERDYCRGLLVLGESRCGKTHSIGEWVARRRSAKPGFRCAFAEVPPNPTIKGAAGVLLEAVGDPDPDYGSENDRTRRLATIGQGYDLIVVDEVQRLVDEKTGRVRGDVAGWLTSLLNKRICPMAFAGEAHAAHVFADKVYLEGRLLGEVPVTPFDWNDKADRLEFRTLLHLVDGQLGMPEPSGLGDLDVALRIDAYAEGRVGNATRLIDEARSIAKAARHPKLLAEDLAAAVDVLRVGIARDRENPFRVASPSRPPRPDERDGKGNGP
jgi:hypothetical protein